MALSFHIFFYLLSGNVAYTILVCSSYGAVLNWMSSYYVFLPHSVHKSGCGHRKKRNSLFPPPCHLAGFGPSHTHWPLFGLYVPTELLVSFWAFLECSAPERLSQLLMCFHNVLGRRRNINPISQVRNSDREGLGLNASVWIPDTPEHLFSYTISHVQRPNLMDIITIHKWSLVQGQNPVSSIMYKGGHWTEPGHQVPHCSPWFIPQNNQFQFKGSLLTHGPKKAK